MVTGRQNIGEVVKRLIKFGVPKVAWLNLYCIYIAYIKFGLIEDAMFAQVPLLYCESIYIYIIYIHTSDNESDIYPCPMKPFVKPRCLSCWCSWLPSRRIYRDSRRRPCRNMSQHVWKQLIEQQMAMPQNTSVPKMFFFLSHEKVNHPSPTFIELYILILPGPGV